MRCLKNGILIVAFLLAPAGLLAQSESRIGLSFGSEYIPALSIEGSDFNPGAAYEFQLYFYDASVTRLHVGLHYSRGYHSSISYSAGLSAGYVISLSDRLTLTPGLEITDFKMSERNCRTSFRSVLNTIFDADDPCVDNSHISFNPNLTATFSISGPFSLNLQAGYRTMLSNMHREKERVSEPIPGGGSIERTYYESTRSF